VRHVVRADDVPVNVVQNVTGHEQAIVLNQLYSHAGWLRAPRKGCSRRFPSRRAQALMSRVLTAHGQLLTPRLTSLTSFLTSAPRALAFTRRLR
jgi:hypothetical protein